MVLRGARCAIGPRECLEVSIEVVSSHISCIPSNPSYGHSSTEDRSVIDLNGFLILPGLINAHDHLEFALFPRLANPPYKNYIEWGIDIHNTCSDIIATHRSVPKNLRIWWGGIRNLLCGVTTVGHHNPFQSEFRRGDFPVRVIQEYGWAHSVALGGDLRAARRATQETHPFIVHACEGVDDQARDELLELDRMELLDARTVLVHGLAIGRDGVALMRERGASLIVCPSSNHFLFGRIPDISLLSEIENLTLGNDSPLTAEGDLLDEIRFAIRFCNIPPQVAYRMVTEAPAAILRTRGEEGFIRVSGIADLIAVQDTGDDASERLKTLSLVDIEFVMLGGQVQLASKGVLERLPSQVRQGLEPLSIDGTIRWLRAPVKELLRQTEEVLGVGQVRLGGKLITIPLWAETEDFSQLKECDLPLH
jgi:Amidohydrolase family